MSRPRLTAEQRAYRQDFGARLRGFRKTSPFTMAELAEIAGVSAGFWADVEVARSAASEGFLLGLKKIPGLPFEEIVGEDFLIQQTSKFNELSQLKKIGDISLKTATSDNSDVKNKLGRQRPSSDHELGRETDWSGFVQVPRWSVVASLGPGADVYEPQIVETLAFKASFLREMGVNPKHASIITGVGDSMEPKIFDSDFLIVDNAVRAYVNKGVYVLAENDRLVAKKIEHERKTGDFLIISENKEKYPMRRVSEDDAATIHIMGRVKRAWSSRPI